MSKLQEMNVTMTGREIREQQLAKSPMSERQADYIVGRYALKGEIIDKMSLKGKSQLDAEKLLEVCRQLPSVNQVDAYNNANGTMLTAMELYEQGFMYSNIYADGIAPAKEIAKLNDNTDDWANAFAIKETE